MKARLSIFALGTALVVAAACGGGDSAGPSGTPPTSNPNPTAPPPPPPPPSTPVPPSAPPPEERVEPPVGSFLNFDIVDDSFVDPNGNHDQEGRGEVKNNRIVSWTQNGKNIHRVEFSKAPQGAAIPDSGDLRPGSTWEFRPTEPGEYIFFCRYHEYMMDVVITVLEN